MTAASSARWSRTALALAVLLGSLPLAGRLFLGAWGFPGAAELAVVCVIVASYLQLSARRYRPIPDTALILERALSLADSGDTDTALALLTEAIRLDPRVWQAWQYRGQMRLLREEWRAALEDFEEALRLAPEEADLRLLREYAQSRM